MIWWFGFNQHHPTPIYQIKNEWNYQKKLLLWIYYLLITSFFYAKQVFWTFWPSALPLSRFDTKIQCENKNLVLCTVLKWGVALNRVWTLALDGPPWPKTDGFCNLLGTPYAPVSKKLSVKLLKPLLIKHTECSRGLHKRMNKKIWCLRNRESLTYPNKSTVEKSVAWTRWGLSLPLMKSERVCLKRRTSSQKH